MAKCKAKTIKGKRCKKTASKDGFCLQHHPEGNMGGRPTDYKPAMLKEVYLSVLEGATWESIAKRCGRNILTVIAWCDPESSAFIETFAQAVKEAKAAANGNVEQSLFRNAIGQTLHTHSERMEYVMAPRNKAERSKVEKFIDKDGMILKHIIEDTHTEIKGETGAQALWLCNRDKANWQHVANIERAGDAVAQVRIIDNI